jgi:hypothetical protein
MGARAHHPQHRVDEQAIIAPGPAWIVRLAGQKRGEALPLRRRQFVPLRHRPCSEPANPEYMVSKLNRFENPECRLDLVAEPVWLENPLYFANETMPSGQLVKLGYVPFTSSRRLAQFVSAVDTGRSHRS